MRAYVALLNSLPQEDEHALGIFSLMFVFSSLVVAGYVAVSTRQKGLRRGLLSILAFIVSYATFRSILYYAIALH
jgi:hypothetical protein